MYMKWIIPIDNLLRDQWEGNKTNKHVSNSQNINLYGYFFVEALIQAFDNLSCKN